MVPSPGNITMYNQQKIFKAISPPEIMIKEATISIIIYFISSVIFALGASVLNKLTIINSWSSRFVKYTKIIFLILSVVYLLLFLYSVYIVFF
jgi:hypothetical protein